MSAAKSIPATRHPSTGYTVPKVTTTRPSSNYVPKSGPLTGANVNPNNVIKQK